MVKSLSKSLSDIRNLESSLALNIPNLLIDINNIENEINIDKHWNSCTQGKLNIIKKFLEYAKSRKTGYSGKKLIFSVEGFDECCDFGIEKYFSSYSRAIQYAITKELRENSYRIEEFSDKLLVQKYLDLKIQAEDLTDNDMIKIYEYIRNYGIIHEKIKFKTDVSYIYAVRQHEID